MSRIDDLIAEACPTGVAHRRLGDVGEFIRGNGLQKSDLADQGFPAIHYGQIHTFYGTWTATTKSFTDAGTAAKLRRAKPGDLIIATTSEDDAGVAKATAWMGEGEVAVSGDAYIYRHSLDPRFVAYFFQSTIFQDQKATHITGAKVRRVSGESLARIRIPAPPIEVQAEIVRVLDHFTELDAQLAAELVARREQYAFYRSRLVIESGADEVTIGSLGRWLGGMTPSKADPRYWDAGTIPWLASMDVSATSGRDIRGRITQTAVDETSLRIVPPPSVVVVMRSNILRRLLPIGFVTSSTTVNQDIRILIPRDGVDAEYVYHALLAASEDIRASCVRTDGSMAAVDPAGFFAWSIPLPSYAEQREIAAMLRQFDTLVNDQSSGLPAEIDARRRQFAYYRDRFMTFPEAAA